MINIKCINFSAHQELLDYTNKKVEKLNNFHTKILGIDVLMKTENTNDKENKTSEIIVRIPGNQFIVKKTHESFEKAVSDSYDSMSRILKEEK